MVLHLEENLAADERPDDWVYILPWELDRHLAEVRSKREDKSKGGGSSAADEDWDGAQFSRNELVPNSWGRGS